MPDKTVNTSIPLPEDLHADLKDIAKEDGRSLGQEAVFGLREFVRSRKQPRPLRK